MATAKKTTKKKFICQRDAVKVYNDYLKLKKSLDSWQGKVDKKKDEKLSDKLLAMHQGLVFTMTKYNDEIREKCGVNFVLGTVYKD